MMLGFIDYELLMNLLAKEANIQAMRKKSGMAWILAFPSATSRACFRGGYFGGAEEDRTPDLLCARQVLSQLSYGPKAIRSRRGGSGWT